MDRKIVLLGILIVCLFGSGNLFGDGMFFIGIQGGWSQQNIDIKDIEFDKNTAFLYGARVGIRCWESMGFAEDQHQLSGIECSLFSSVSYRQSLSNVWIRYVHGRYQGYWKRQKRGMERWPGFRGVPGQKAFSPGRGKV